MLPDLFFQIVVDLLPFAHGHIFMENPFSE